MSYDSVIDSDKADFLTRQMRLATISKWALVAAGITGLTGFAVFTGALATAAGLNNATGIQATPETLAQIEVARIAMKAGVVLMGASLTASAVHVVAKFKREAESLRMYRPDQRICPWRSLVRLGSVCIVKRIAPRNG